jgi:hypothetical protein
MPQGLLGRPMGQADLELRLSMEDLQEQVGQVPQESS